MRLKFLSPLREGRTYQGIIRKYDIKDDKFQIFVEIENEPNNLYLNSQRMSMRSGSPFYLFCRRMGVIDNGLDLDYLIDLLVEVTFKKGEDGNMYISNICVAEVEEEEDDSVEDYD